MTCPCLTRPDTCTCKPGTDEALPVLESMIAEGWGQEAACRVLFASPVECPETWTAWVDARTRARFPWWRPIGTEAGRVDWFFAAVLLGLVLLCGGLLAGIGWAR